MDGPEPFPMVEPKDWTKAGSLPSWALLAVAVVFRQNGFVLLPSDTCYSVATAVKDNAPERINRLLNRDEEPVSLAFQNLKDVKRFIKLSDFSGHIIERFTPGPITVVCPARAAKAEEYIQQALASPRGNIGVRIPDSAIERAVAGCTDYPITTVAVRDHQSKKEVQDFDTAFGIVQAGMQKMGRSKWGAIRGELFYPKKHSTVVIIDENDRMELKRQGEIPYDVIQRTAQEPPRSRPEDW
jgi:L-threonylcarbamoyladenylate synthase